MGCLQLTYHPVPELQIIGGRNYLTSEKSENNERSGYLFGFNGMEMDNDVSGYGNSYTTEFRQNDPRLGGRWWSMDPIVKPWESPYAGYANNPIFYSDPSGLDPEETTTTKPPVDGERRGDQTYDKESDSWMLDVLEVMSPERQKGEQRTREKGSLWKTDLGREAIFPTGTVLPKGWSYMGTGVYSTEGRTNMIQMMHDYPGTYHMFMPQTSLGYEISQEFRNGGRDAIIAFATAMSIPVGFAYVSTVSTFAFEAQVATYVYGDIALNYTIGGIGGAYVYVGYRAFGERFLRFHPRILSQTDAGHRATAFVANDLLKQWPKIRNWNTLSYPMSNQEGSSNYISIGVNPWKRSIFHYGPSTK